MFKPLINYDLGKKKSAIFLPIREIKDFRRFEASLYPFNLYFAMNL